MTWFCEDVDAGPAAGQRGAARRSRLNNDDSDDDAGGDASSSDDSDSASDTGGGAAAASRRHGKAGGSSEGAEEDASYGEAPGSGGSTGSPKELSLDDIKVRLLLLVSFVFTMITSALTTAAAEALSTMCHDRSRFIACQILAFSPAQSCYHLGLRDAANKLGVCSTTLKRHCRKHGICKWPNRELKKYNKAMAEIQRLHSGSGATLPLPAAVAAVAAAAGGGAGSSADLKVCP